MNKFVKFARVGLLSLCLAVGAAGVGLAQNQGGSGSGNPGGTGGTGSTGGTNNGGTNYNARADNNSIWRFSTPIRSINYFVSS